MLQAACYEFLQTKNDLQLLGVKGEKEAFLASEVALLLGKKSYVLPDLRANRGDDLLSFHEEIVELLRVLQAFYKDNSTKKILIAPLRTLLTPLPKAELFNTLSLEFGMRLHLEHFKEQMFYWGYLAVDVVQDKGEISVRGDIIDIFPPDSEKALRLSLFDDEVESIRFFDCESQKSAKEELESYTLFPALFALDEERHTLMQKRIDSLKSDSFTKDVHSLGLWVLGESGAVYTETFKTYLSMDAVAELEEIALFDEDGAKSLQSLPSIPEAKSYREIAPSNIKTFLELHHTKKITLLAKNEVLLRIVDIEPLHVKWIQSERIVNIMNAEEIILSLNKPSTKIKRKRANIVLDELKNGDYVVHEHYGIGIFKGLTQVTVLGATKDFVLIEYLGDDKLLLPVENLHVIDRYIGESGGLVSVDRLGKGSFQKLKAKTRERLLEIASEIIAIAAKREMVDGLSIAMEQGEMALFEADAGFTYTEDQKRVIGEILSDFKSGKMMDRLLSGDVGFGKTEVAMNAIFATVRNGFQAILIAPTTLLCSQHFKSLSTRFAKYNIKVAQLDRFTSPAQKQVILKELKSGELHVCVGTHSLFEVELHNPALVVVDEEHKFGVKQKEKLKNFRENVHILSMSATPIPRSLNMALSSIKQYSQLLTPPNDREDVRTFVKEYDEKVIKEAIIREMRRGGQIFFVHNRIATIEAKRKELLSMMPNLRILTLHSEISAAITEKEMLHFEEKAYDVLLSTSIIESGIHIPNVNTILIDSADHFGMADLHQLRGRVGRSKRQGFCYFLVKDKEELSESAKKRLIALESNSYLGSGSILAYHDLEIRGGGNLVGEAQSGHIKNIGYSLYLKMLEDAINSLLGKTPIASREVEIKLSISAFISDNDIAEDRVRLELYRRLSRCGSVHDVLEIEEEMVDRFGKLDVSTKQFLQLIEIKILATQQNIVLISNYGQNITIKYEDEKKIMLQSRSRDDDDIIATVLMHLRIKA
ncbi:Transcription-repair-coupling factor [Sulfurospirillum diekertiae]|uniref:Transcription-repair-coupling factor n=1 Tax=Sulfurospirillum diekertiae TaxID=1854492 RepID=A0A1Y0HM90_9BACT|nr:transcription-repair coupling factor [Sulfurospirillum diekertiae]ARU49237.1 Transcription-repair-coupling factor [Sulfurospirillum diekertiae]